MTRRSCLIALIPSVFLLALSAFCGDLRHGAQRPKNEYYQGGKPRPGTQPPPISSQPTEAWMVEAAFRQAVQLWADERFDALWEHGLLASRYRVSREAFARWMRHRVVKPTCCWGQIR